MENKSQYPYLPLDEFLKDLKKNGFTVGIDTYVRLYKILENIDFKLYYDELETILCPIFANNQSDQIKFYSIFKRHFRDESEITKPELQLDQDEIKQKKALRDNDLLIWNHQNMKALFILLGSVVVTFIVIVLIIIIPSLDSSSQQKSPMEIQRGEQFESPVKKSEGDVDEEKSVLEKILPLLVLILPVFIILLLIQIYIFNKNRLAIHQLKNKSPPFVWPIFIDSKDIVVSNEFQSIATNMRFWQERTSLKFDIAKSIHATIKNWGLTNFKYSPQKRSIEYLILIDYSSNQNHQVQLFEYFNKALLKNDIHIERFFYDNDMRICWSERYPDGIYLSDIQSKYSEHTLLLFGNGEKIIDPISGEIGKWANLFRHWKQKILLTPIPSADWGYSEIILSDLFDFILPLTPQGLLELTEHIKFRETTSTNINDWKYNKRRRRKAIYIDEDDLIVSLRKHFKPDVLEWIAACAIYPDLYWDLTVYIGKILSTDDNYLPTLTNLKMISDLKWFQQGKMPDEVRCILLSEGILSVDKQRRAREEIVKLMKKNIPDKKYYAYDNFLLNLTYNELLLNSDKREKIKLERKLKKLSKTALRQNQDFVILEHLKNSKIRPLSFVIPTRILDLLRRYINRFKIISKKGERKDSTKKVFKKFPGQFWLVVMFEFFERGAYYGMMSFISVYFSDVLSFPKENVGIIKGVISPFLYLLPIISGSLADRFGYRKVLMVAFTLLGGGYFLTSQMTTYTAVFAALVIMGFGAGLFKPLISGTIAKMTDESNSTQAFGIYYWSINMGAFLFPLILVPFLKSLNPTYVIIASAICTAAMIVPTLFLFKEPGLEEKIKEREQKGFVQTTRDLIHTLAHAFEIIYSPVVLIYQQMKRSGVRKVVIGLLLAALLVYSVWSFLDRPPAAEQFPTIGIQQDGSTLIFKVVRDMLIESPYKLESTGGAGQTLFLTIYKPRYLEQFSDRLLKDLRQFPDLRSVGLEDLQDYIRRSDEKIQLTFEWREGTGSDSAFEIETVSDRHFTVRLDRSLNYPEYSERLLAGLHETPLLRGLTPDDCRELYDQLNGRAFFLLFVVSLLLIGLAIVAISLKNNLNQSAAPTTAKTAGFRLPVILAPAAIIALWFLPEVGTLTKIICSVIYLSVTSLFIIEKEDAPKFVDHFKFLLMIFLYSGFWVLYFQMFDSVLWYVQAYVDAASLNNAINSFLGFFGIHINWFFDVEHVTVINAGTIILLQLVISAIVKKKKALPTMITGIAIATVGMAILAISTSIWVFLIGIGLFSVGEMTAHPKFISYVGLTAPAEKKAMYMGYLFLYGVFGSSIGGIMGAKLYVYFVDTLNQPHTLWLVFASIGVVTMICLLLYNKFLTPKKSPNTFEKTP